MGAALIGLLGVVAGVVLTAGMNVWLEQRRLRAAALAAGWLMVGELAVVIRKLEAAVESRAWWDGQLPTQRWEQHVGELAFAARRLGDAPSTARIHGDRQDVDASPATESPAADPAAGGEKQASASSAPGTLDRLTAAYAIIQSYNDDRAAGGDAKLDQAKIDELRRSATALDAARKHLAGKLAPRPRLERIVPLLLVAAAAAAISLIPLPGLTEASVEQSLYRSLQRFAPSSVECDAQRGDWACDVTFERACPARIAARPARKGRSRAFAAVAQTSGSACRATFEGSRAETTDGHRLTFTPGAAERRANIEVIHAPSPRRSLFRRVWDVVTGG